jgi:uncharacterized membrane protein YphA (DoxX/SURF4 family)
MKNRFPRKGILWRTSGFTKTHYWGVSITAGCFIIAGVCLGLFSFVAREQAVRILLSAIFCLLVGCVTLLGSIVTLLFYLGSFLKIEDEEPSCQAPDAKH